MNANAHLHSLVNVKHNELNIHIAKLTGDKTAGKKMLNIHIAISTGHKLGWGVSYLKKNMET